MHKRYESSQNQLYSDWSFRAKSYLQIGVIFHGSCLFIKISFSSFQDIEILITI